MASCSRRGADRFARGPQKNPKPRPASKPEPQTQAAPGPAQPLPRPPPSTPTCARRLGLEDGRPAAAPLRRPHAHHAARVPRRGEPLLREARPRQRSAAAERQRARRRGRRARDVVERKREPLPAGRGRVPVRGAGGVDRQQQVAARGERDRGARQRKARELAAGGGVKAQRARRRRGRDKAAAWARAGRGARGEGRGARGEARGARGGGQIGAGLGLGVGRKRLGCVLLCQGPQLGITNWLGACHQGRFPARPAAAALHPPAATHAGASSAGSCTDQSLLAAQQSKGRYTSVGGASAPVIRHSAWETGGAPGGRVTQEGAAQPPSGRLLAAGTASCGQRSPKTAPGQGGPLADGPRTRGAAVGHATLAQRCDSEAKVVRQQRQLGAPPGRVVEQHLRRRGGGRKAAGGA
jgi:hypothetical protein